MSESDEELETKAKDAVLDDEHAHARPDWIARRAPFQDGYIVGYRARAAEEAPAEKLGGSPPVSCGMVAIPDPTTGERIYRDATDEEKSADAQRRKLATEHEVECYQVGWRAREERYIAEKADRTKGYAELIATAQSGLRVTTYHLRRNAHEALDKLAALLGVK